MVQLNAIMMEAEVHLEGWLCHVPSSRATSVRSASLCDEVIGADPQSVADCQAGKDTALNFIKGQGMELSKR